MTLSREWTAQHLLLQQDFRRQNIANILEEFLPAEVIDKLSGRFVMVCRPQDSGATTIRPERVAGRHVIVLSKYLTPTSNPPMNFPKEYIALILLHELAHVHLDHYPPTTDQMEDDADQQALDWFNQQKGTMLTMEDLNRIHRDRDMYWIDGK